MEYSAAQLSYLQHLDIDVWVMRAANEPLPVNHVVQQEPATNAMSALAGIVNNNQETVVNTPLPQHTTQQAIAHAPQRNQSVPEQAQVQSAGLINIPTNTQEKSASFGGLKAPSFPKADVPTPVGQEEAQSEVAQQVVPQYTLQFWCYSSGLWLVSAETELSPAHHMLAHNVAQFVHGKKRKPRHVGIFSWPMLAAPNIDQSAAVAQKYLAQHILQLSGLVECKKLLVFNDVGDTLSQHSAIEMPNSLGQLLIEPLLKKQLWQFLLSHQIES